MQFLIATNIFNAMQFFGMLLILLCANTQKEKLTEYNNMIEKTAEKNNNNEM